MISVRTKAAMAAAKARGVRLSRPENLRNGDTGRVKGRAAQTTRKEARTQDLRPILQALEADGARSLRAIASKPNARGIPAAKGGAWSAVQVRRVLAAPTASK